MENDFNTLDKLVEFGLGLGVATQMMNTMNSIIKSTAIPGVGINPGTSPRVAINYPEVLPTEYYIVYQEKTSGPYGEYELNTLIRKGIVGKDTFLWAPGMKGWSKAESIPQINKLILRNYSAKGKGARDYPARLAECQYSFERGFPVFPSGICD